MAASQAKAAAEKLAPPTPEKSSQRRPGFDRLRTDVNTVLQRPQVLMPSTNADAPPRLQVTRHPAGLRSCCTGQQRKPQHENGTESGGWEAVVVVMMMTHGVNNALQQPKGTWRSSVCE